MIRNYAHRQAINAPIQGTAADIIKRAMIKYYTISKTKNLKILNYFYTKIHDELIFEIKDDLNLQLIIDQITNIMSKAHLPIISFDTPIEVSVVGKG